MIKNNLLTEPNQYILYLSETYEGTVHDKKICDIENYNFPDNFLLRYDLGYVGYTPENIIIEKSYKNTKLNPLTEEQKKENNFRKKSFNRAGYIWCKTIKNCRG